VNNEVGSMPLSPRNDDVVARIGRGDSSAVYLIGTAATPDQFIVGTRDEALSKALAYARRERIGAWFAGDDGFVLLGTFRKDAA